MKARELNVIGEIEGLIEDVPGLTVQHRYSHAAPTVPEQNVWSDEKWVTYICIGRLHDDSPELWSCVQSDLARIDLAELRSRVEAYQQGMTYVCKLSRMYGNAKPKTERVRDGIKALLN
tara:strand:- start:3691 stop:4047 length:357 start_codon:yes stop_codon:yes gene_type:complete